MGRTRQSGAFDSVNNLLVRENYAPWYLVKLANAMTRGASRVYLRLFDIGIVEWRILSMLAIEPRSSAQRICDELEMDKASVSRSVRELIARGLLISDPDDQRRMRPLELSAAGREQHDKILKIAVERERLLMQGFSRDEMRGLLATLRRLEANLEAVEEHERHMIQQHGDN